MKRKLSPSAITFWFGVFFILLGLDCSNICLTVIMLLAGIFEIIISFYLFIRSRFDANGSPHYDPPSTTVQKQYQTVLHRDGSTSTIITCTSDALLFEITERDSALRRLYGLQREERLREEERLHEEKRLLEQALLKKECSSIAFDQILKPIPRVIITPDKNSEMHPLALGDFFPTTSGVRSNQSVKRLRDFVVIDIETTGLTPGYESIVQISALRFLDFRAAELFETYIKPSMKIPPEAQSIHHITDDMVKDAPRFCEIQDQFSAFIGKSPLVGHNLYFDLKFLRKAGYDSDSPGRLYFDTLEISRSKDEIFSHKLTDACKHHNIMFNSAHSASSDALACGLLFLSYLRTYANTFSGITTEYEAYQSVSYHLQKQAQTAE